MHAVIMTGGSGARFWPVSRSSTPKQFLDITGSGPMVVETCNRLSPLLKDEKMILILGQRHLKEAKSLFKGRAVHMLAEPVGKNTAPCIGLGAIYAEYLGCRGPVAFLPADHFIGNPASFIESLRAAGDLASSGGIVTIGIVPSRPETGYGYIKRGESLADVGKMNAYKVSEFKEKPDLEDVCNYIKSGEYYWNGGIFVATADTILMETKRLLPDLYEGLADLKKVLGTDRFEGRLREVYSDLSGVSFDYGIMERTDEEIYVIPCDCGWSDVGSWSSLYELRSADHDDKNNIAEGENLLIDCEHSFISSRAGRCVACLGLKNCLVVDTPEALLVADIDRSQDIRKIVEQLRKDGKERLL